MPSVNDKTISVETAAELCHCSQEDVLRWRKRVLPRPPGSVGDPRTFVVSEVVAMAAGAVVQTWRTKANVDQLVARLAMKKSDDRDWVVVYESRKGLRVETTPFTLAMWGTKRGAIFDPAPYYEAFDAWGQD